MAAVLSFIILKSYFPWLPAVRSIAWLDLRVFLKKAFIYLSFSISALTLAVSLRLVEMHPIECEHATLRLHATRAADRFWMRMALHDPRGLASPVVILRHADAISSVKLRGAHKI